MKPINYLENLREIGLKIINTYNQCIKNIIP